MKKVKSSLTVIAFLAVALPVAASAAEPRNACGECHAEKVSAIGGGKHASTACKSCHEGSDVHQRDPKTLPRVHFDMEVCQGCHTDQYNSFRFDVVGKTSYGGAVEPVAQWSKTQDFPYWNSIIAGHPFVQETYEDRNMMFNQIDAMETIRPKSESCLNCHGTKVAYYMGINFRDADGKLVTYPAKELTTYREQTITTGTTNPQKDGTWSAETVSVTVPSGTRVRTYTDAVNEPRYQVKTVVKLPDGRIYASYPEARKEYMNVTATGADSDPVKRTEARQWVYAGLQAMAFDGLDYKFTKVKAGEPYHGEGKNWPSIEAGELCNQCHDPHSGKLRLIRKAAIEGIARNGINPYDAKKSKIRKFEEGSRQDQISAVCGQCHVEYVGGYSAIDNIDRDFFPWGKPAKVEKLYSDIFGYNQDWKHGGPVLPWQTEAPGQRGYYPKDSLHVTGVPLIKSQHPEMEMYWNSVMYKAGASCTDCHAPQVKRADGTTYTSHWFASPIKWTQHKGVITCNKCHEYTPEQQLGSIKDKQDDFFKSQQETQLQLVETMKAIKAAKDKGKNVSDAVPFYQQAHLRWEYYTQSENSMGFHNWDEAKQELILAKTLAAHAARLVAP